MKNESEAIQRLLIHPKNCPRLEARSRSNNAPRMSIATRDGGHSLGGTVAFPRILPRYGAGSMLWVFGS